ncbi:MAG: hypothetical protein Kow0026_19490 [Oricola sp.]
MVAVARQIDDHDLRVGQRLLDEAFDLLSVHGHAGAPFLEVPYGPMQDRRQFAAAPKTGFKAPVTAGKGVPKPPFMSGNGHPAPVACCEPNLHAPGKRGFPGMARSGALLA